MAVITFATFIMTDPEHHILTPKTAFVSLSLFNILRIPLSLLPKVIALAVQCWVSNIRMKSFFGAEELDLGTVTRNDPRQGAVGKKLVTICNNDNNDNDIIYRLNSLQWTILWFKTVPSLGTKTARLPL